MNRIQRLVLSDKFFLIAGLFLFALLSGGTAFHESPTFDEPLHLTAGEMYWKTGTYLIDLVDPPLPDLWASLPLLAAPLHTLVPFTLWSHQKDYPLFDYFVYQNAWPPDAIIGLGRCMMILVGVGLGALLWRWTKELWGKSAARGCLIAYVFCPPLLAYSHLITCDFMHAAGCVLTLYTFWRFTRRPTLPSSVVFGLAFGVSVMCKLSGLLMIVPIVGIAILLKYRKEFPELRWSEWGIRSLVAFAAGAVVVLLTYVPAGLSRLPEQWQALNDLLGGVTRHYFHGTVYSQAPHWFAAVCFLLKTPLPFLALIGVGLFRFRNHLHEPHQNLWIWVVFPAAVYLASLSMSGHIMGLRRELFLYPLGCMLIGRTVSGLWNESRAARVGVMLLGFWYVGSTALAYPRYLSYFNECIPTSQRYRWLADCNLDWGQGEKELARYLKKRGVSAIYFNGFGSATPAAYGIRYRLVDPVPEPNADRLSDLTLDVDSQPKALFALSATNWAGLYYSDPSVFRWLDKRAPTAVIMDSILVYDVTDDAAARRRLAEDAVGYRPPIS